MKNETPRRNNFELNTNAERAISIAIREVETEGANNKLTEAITLLSKAKELVGDYVDEKQKKLHPTGTTKLEQLAFYLPYELLCIVDGKSAILNSVYSDGTCSFSGLVESSQGFKNIEPVLKPLAVADAYIYAEYVKYVEGKKYDEKLKSVFLSGYIGSDSITLESIEKLPFNCILWLLKENYDIFGMIDRGEARIFKM